MAEQIIRNPEALKLFFNEDIYLIPDELAAASAAVEKAPATAVPEVSATSPVSFPYLGTNARKILVLFNVASLPLPNQEENDLLENILKAIGLRAEDCALVNYPACSGSTFAALSAYFQPQLLLSFGLDPQTLGLAAQVQHVLSTQQGIPTIFSIPLQELSSNMPAKRALWGSLKQLQLT